MDGEGSRFDLVRRSFNFIYPEILVKLFGDIDNVIDKFDERLFHSLCSSAFLVRWIP